MQPTVAVSLDLEFDKDTLLCAATSWTNGTLNLTQTWVSHNLKGYDNLQPATIDALIMQLWAYHCSGLKILTWGGTGSDWIKLYNHAASPEWKVRVRQMALASIDIPLISAAANGMMMSLTSTAMGMGVGARPACDSEDVPRLWNSQDASKQHDVVKHVQWDAWACAELWNKLNSSAQFSRPLLSWVTKRSGVRSVRLHRTGESGSYGLPCVMDILSWAPPETMFEVPLYLRVDTQTAWLRAEQSENL
jgi:hypothetical protein